jgi:hypothetical protein
MGKKLTEHEINEMIAANPNSQLFDQCCICEGYEDHLEMNSVEDPDSFDTICDECQSKTKKGEVTELLIDIFDRINIDQPQNFDQILEFVYQDVCETADQANWNDGDVAIAFRRWIEKDIK